MLKSRFPFDSDDEPNQPMRLFSATYQKLMPSIRKAPVIDGIKNRVIVASTLFSPRNEDVVDKDIAAAAIPI